MVKVGRDPERWIYIEQIWSLGTIATDNVILQDQVALAQPAAFKRRLKLYPQMSMSGFWRDGPNFGGQKFPIAIMGFFWFCFEGIK